MKAIIHWQHQTFQYKNIEQDKHIKTITKTENKELRNPNQKKTTMTSSQTYC